MCVPTSVSVFMLYNLTCNILLSTYPNSVRSFKSRLSPDSEWNLNSSSSDPVFPDSTKEFGAHVFLNWFTCSYLSILINSFKS